MQGDLQPTSGSLSRPAQVGIGRGGRGEGGNAPHTIAYTRHTLNLTFPLSSSRVQQPDRVELRRRSTTTEKHFIAQVKLFLLPLPGRAGCEARYKLFNADTAQIFTYGVLAALLHKICPLFVAPQTVVYRLIHALCIWNVGGPTSPLR